MRRGPCTAAAAAARENARVAAINKKAKDRCRKKEKEKRQETKCSVVDQYHR